MATFFKIAHGTKPLESSDQYPWPYDIGICFEKTSSPIAFCEGVGHGSAGCIVSAAVALEPQWIEHYRVCNGEWLIPYIRNLNKAIPLPREEILQKYRETHGKEPDSYQSKSS